MKKIEAYRGCLLGLAAGDAVGTAVEFYKPGTFTPITDMVGGGCFRLRPGEWTDDTSMALCLGQSLLDENAFNAFDQMEKYVLWRECGYMSSNGTCFDIGGTVNQALNDFLITGNPYAGTYNETGSGNGSLMRLAPVVLFYAEHPAEAMNMAARSSKTTHGTQQCTDACRYFAGLLIGALNGATKEELLSPMYTPVEGYWEKHPLCPEIEAIVRGSYKTKSAKQIPATGYVVDSLEAALWGFYHTTNFAQGCLKVANLGNDADSTAAIYGQLAGAFYGRKAIPMKWRNLLAKSKFIKNMADELRERALKK